MKKIKEGEEVDVPNFDPGLFSATRTDDEGIMKNIRKNFILLVTSDIQLYIITYN